MILVTLGVSDAALIQHGTKSGNELLLRKLNIWSKKHNPRPFSLGSYFLVPLVGQSTNQVVDTLKKLYE
jgi:hypothetical protein